LTISLNNIITGLLLKEMVKELPGKYFVLKSWV